MNCKNKMQRLCSTHTNKRVLTSKKNLPPESNEADDHDLFFQGRGVCESASERIYSQQTKHLQLRYKQKSSREALVHGTILCQHTQSLRLKPHEQARDHRSLSHRSHSRGYCSVLNLYATHWLNECILVHAGVDTCKTAKKKEHFQGFFTHMIYMFWKKKPKECKCQTKNKHSCHRNRLCRIMLPVHCVFVQ